MHRTAVLLVALLLAACDRDPVDWNDAAERSAAVPTAARRASDATADSILQATLRGAIGGGAIGGAASDTAILPGLPDDVLSARGPACVTSVRVVAGGGGERDAVWWARRPDSTASLVLARSADAGVRWLPVVPVDTLDRAPTGCSRPAPSVALDARNGYLHVAYSLVAPEGTGVFYAHRMGAMMPFERPMVITYGDHVTPVSVASDGDLVVVAYEDPNTGGRPYVSLAISRTAGHSWDERVAVSNSSVSAVRPQVAVRGRTVAVGWVERRSTAGDDESAATAAAQAVVVRVGRIR